MKKLTIKGINENESAEDEAREILKNFVGVIKFAVLVVEVKILSR